MTSKYDVAIVGLGVIGLPFAAVLAKAGHRVLGVDIDARRIQHITTDKHPSGEADVDEVVRAELITGRLTCSTKLDPAKAYIICVPTPLQQKAKRADLTFVVSAATAIARVASPGELVVVESTVPPGCLRGSVAPIFRAAGKEGVLLAHAPERLLPGNVLKELEGNDRIVGGLTPEATIAAAKLYRSFAKGQVFETNADTAEMVKIIENTYRDVNVALANELALIARNAGVDEKVAFELANRHPRVNLLSPGIGVGGHCLPVDPWFLHEIDPENAVLIAAARRVNDHVPERVSDDIQKWFVTTQCRKLLLVGKSYKAGVWDPRESPAIEIGERLHARGLDLHHWDPLEPEAGNVPYAGPDTAVVLLVGHKEAHDFLAAAKDAGARADATTGKLKAL